MKNVTPNLAIRIGQAAIFCLFTCNALPQGVDFTPDNVSSQILVSNKAWQEGPKSRRQSLEVVLKQLEKEHAITFFYTSDLMEGKFIKMKDFNLKNLEEGLTRLLDSVNLRFRKLEDNTYVIYRAVETMPLNSRNKTSAIPSLPSAPLSILSSATSLAVATITGKVTDPQNQPLPGVSVVLKGTTTGTVTDGSGAYTLQVSALEGALVFSFIGYTTQEEPVGGRSQINVNLVADIKALQEVVVVGYGKENRRDLVGSISKVSSEDLNRQKTTSVTEALQGMASGLYIRNSSGHPGNGPEIRIRGKNSINLSTSPLWIVDGVPIQTGSMELAVDGVKPVSPIAMLNPADIQSIEVLKDAAATAIYGNRGSNGVIIVTTKSPQKGRTDISFSYDGGIAQLPFRQNDIFVDSQTYWQLADQAWANAGNQSELQPVVVTRTGFMDEKPNLTREEAINTNNDMLAALTRQSSFQQFGISGNKGFEKGGALFSLNYRDEKGVIKSNDFKRITGRLGLNLEVVPKVTMGLNANFTYIKNE